MQISRQHDHVHSQSACRLGKIVLVIATLLLLFQILATSFHHHSVGDKVECANCTLVAHFTPDLSPGPLGVEPPAPLLAYQLTAALLYAFFAQQSYLIPLSQAPPRFS